MTRASVTSHLDPEDVSLTVIKRNLFIRTRQTLIKAEPNIEIFEDARFDKHCHALDASDLLVRDKSQVDRSFHPLPLSPKPPDCLQMLDPHTLHVLSSPAVDVTLRVLVGGEWRIGPVLGEHR